MADSYKIVFRQTVRSKGYDPDKLEYMVWDFIDENPFVFKLFERYMLKWSKKR